MCTILYLEVVTRGSECCGPFKLLTVGQGVARCCHLLSHLLRYIDVFSVRSHSRAALSLPSNAQAAKNGKIEIQNFFQKDWLILLGRVKCLEFKVTQP